MRTLLIGILTVGAWLGLGGPAGAGVYHTGGPVYPANGPAEVIEEPLTPPPPPLNELSPEVKELLTRQFWMSINQQRSIAIDNLPQRREAAAQRAGSPYHAYLREKKRLEGVQARGSLTTLDRVDLGACYIRLGQYDKAVAVLREGDQRHFLILHNLATAYLGAGEPREALECQRLALRAWPAVWADWNRLQYRWYRHAERYFLKLLENRAEEWRRNGGRVAKFQTVDPIFPKVRFDDPKLYLPGELPRAVADELPLNAYEVVTQLVLWMPNDERLTWLLAEVLNATGNFRMAYKLLDDLVWNRGYTDPPVLPAHRRVLEQAVKMRGKMAEAGLAFTGPEPSSSPTAKEMRQKLPDVAFPVTFLAVMAPRGGLVPPGAGAVALNASGVAPVKLAQTLAQMQPQAPQKPAAAAAAPTWASWRQVTVGFGAGALFALLAGMQWQEWRRRRQAPTPPGPADSAPPPPGAEAPPAADSPADTRITGPAE